MSLPDSAEYWWDVKSHSFYTGIEYYHIPGFECGHRHHHEAKYVSDVNCKECKEALKNGITHTLKSEEQRIADAAKYADDQLKKIKKKWLNKHPGNPMCTCGFVMLKRKNRQNGNAFWGCANYPTCKNTQSI